ncbi:MAG: ATP-dependent sacrificial sulfur transferase LarE [Deltaproteobacteria bacterium]|nr:ATP-dependent sacrificial sulfur transferase LarE [Candidatus Zymogenaceae bacterium]
MTSTETDKTKYTRLIACIRPHEAATLAVSGGVDSLLLLHAAREALDDNIVAYTATGPFFDPDETGRAAEEAELLGVTHREIFFDPFSIDDLVRNGPDRCYICKLRLFGYVLDAARREGFHVVMDGTNADDPGDYRPGIRALGELKVVSPLWEAGLTKKDIRALSRMLGIEGGDRPAKACYASRFPYGERITPEGVERVRKAEAHLSEMGFVQYRVRSHGDAARVEIATGEMDRALRRDVATEISRRLKEAGFLYVSLDLDGYRTGSLNAFLDDAVFTRKDATKK